MLENLIEGYFVTTLDNLIFEIKGITHPRNRVIAYLRYVPAKSEDYDSDIMFKKVYALDEREKYLQSNYSSYLWFSESHGRILQSVPIDRIRLIHNPVDCLRNLRNRTIRISDLEQATVCLAERFVKSTDIAWSDIGLTGSQLVGTARSDSDIDLVVYGEAACRTFYSNLGKSISSIEGIERYAESILDEHVSFRWGAHEKLRPILREIEREKILQGLFEGVHYFVRLVKTPDDLDYVFGDISYQMKGQYLVSGKVIDDSDSIFTPCEYLVKSEELPDLKKLVSYRGRFTEQISKNMSFEARGRLEIVTHHQKGIQYMQLVLGEHPQDYLIPEE